MSAMTADRLRLPNRRASMSFSFDVGGLKYSATVSCFDDGRIGELLGVALDLIAGGVL